MKLLWMFLFSGFISYWFYAKLGIDYINIWPLNIGLNSVFEFFNMSIQAPLEFSLGMFYPIFTFILTIAIVNAINITDGLDGLCGGLSGMVLGALAVFTFINSWFLSTTVIAVVG